MTPETTPSHPLVFEFIGDVLRHTIDAPTAAAHRQALQALLAELSPWVSPLDLPVLVGQPFTLFEACDFTPTADGTDKEVAVVLSPQGAVLLRAWLRRRGVDPLVCSS
jgi:hypothetical protein